jgi:hypothetical protein
MNGRKKARIAFHVDASIAYNNKAVTGDVLNLSTNGVFIKTQEVIPLETGVEVLIHLSGTTSDLSLKILGDVIRADTEGVAVKFRELEFDTFIYLKNIIEFNTAGQSAILEEYEESKKTQ